VTMPHLQTYFMIAGSNKNSCIENNEIELLLQQKCTPLFNTIALMHEKILIKKTSHHRLYSLHWTFIVAYV
jgi:hypothetical protein